MTLEAIVRAAREAARRESEAREQRDAVMEKRRLTYRDVRRRRAKRRKSAISKRVNDD